MPKRLISARTHGSFLFFFPPEPRRWYTRCHRAILWISALWKPTLIRKVWSFNWKNMLWQESSRFEVLVLKHNKGRYLLAVILLNLMRIFSKWHWRNLPKNFPYTLSLSCWSFWSRKSVIKVVSSLFTHLVSCLKIKFNWQWEGHKYVNRPTKSLEILLKETRWITLERFFFLHPKRFVIKQNFAKINT